MGRSFKMIEETGRFANMIGFANDLAKNNVLIGSADVLHCHGGDQWLVAPVENSEEILDIDLEEKDGLLAIECSYPSNDDLHYLPRLWLMGNEPPRDHAILDEENSIRVLLCWDGESEFEEVDPAMEEVEGGQPTLDLLLGLVNSPMPVLDPSEINGFDATEHIGFEF
eukprot:14271840-Ditylum_brightwellii.AAC.1